MSVNNIKKKRKQKGIDVEKGENERLKNKKILVCGLIILILIVFLIVFKNKIQRIFYPKFYFFGFLIVSRLLSSLMKTIYVFNIKKLIMRNV